MSNQVIDAKGIRTMFLCGAQNLAANKAWINELNVFPVPDGDTGTNMTMTVVSAVKEVSDLGETNNMKTICKAISSGSLRGARGNSGVILSQLFRGFCKIVRDQETVDVAKTADAFDKAVETAYKAVMKPKEGTILTVAKGAAVKARELADQGVTDFDDFLPQMIAYADEVLQSTPDMLPVLKQAGVVDSGGQGLLEFLRGAYQGYKGKEVNIDALLNPAAMSDEDEDEKTEEAELKFGYEVSFIICLERAFNSKLEADLRQYLDRIGEDVTLQPQQEAVKVKVTTNDPGLILQKGLMYGGLVDIKVVNLRLKNEKVPTFGEDNKSAAAAPVAPAQEPEKPHKEMGMIAVCAGEGIAEIFKGLGVDYVISGGQTMNPSTADILDAVEKVNADTVFILPNNKNIILAANQAAAMDGDKKIVVVPTKTIPQGITAVINFMPDQDVETNEANMVQEISRVKTAEVTYAVRDTMIDDVEIHQGNMMAIGDGGILGVGDEQNAVAAAALEKMIGDDTELVSIYYGQEVTEETAAALQEMVANAHPTCEVELQYGGQPVYYYILSAE